jgi:hypothetical protein
VAVTNRGGGGITTFEGKKAAWTTAFGHKTPPPQGEPPMISK